MGDKANDIPVLSRRSGACRLAAAAVYFLALVGTAQAQEGPPGPDSVPAVTQAAPASTDADRRPLGGPRLLPQPTKPGASAGPRADSPSLGILRTGISLAFVLVLAVLAAAIVRRVSRAKGGLAAAFGPGGPSPAGVLEILGRYPVSRGQTLIVLRAHNRILLLAHATGVRLARAGSGGMTALCEFADAEDVAAIVTGVRDAEGDSLAARFRTLLSRFDQRSHDAAGHADDDGAGGGRRCVAVSEHGDRAELWDDQPRSLHLVGDAPAPKAAAIYAPADAVSSLQRRLDAMRVTGGRA